MRLKLTSKIVRKLLFNEESCLDEMFFFKKHSVCVPVTFAC